MRKLKLQMQISLDGFNSTGPNDEQLTYTLLLSKSDNFFANGLLVKTEIGK